MADDLDLPPYWETLDFLSPTSGARADAMADWLSGCASAGAPARVVEIGCGWGELLLRVVARSTALRGLGADLDESRILQARDRAARRGLSDRVDLLVGDAATSVEGPADAVVASGVSQVWGADVEEGSPLDYRAALRGLRGLCAPGARVYYAEAIWSVPPTPAATAPLSGRDDEFLALPDLLDLVTAEGFAVVGLGESTLEEWDAFESGFAAGYATWLAAHEADHPRAAEVRDRALTQRAAYVRGYRGVLGYAHLQLLALQPG